MRRRAELAREELQEQERRRVGGVQVVEHEHERPARGRVPQELGGRVEQAEARALGLERRRLRQVGEAARAARAGSARARAAPAPSCERSAAGSALSRRRRAATAPRASRRGRRPPPSSGRRGPGRRATRASRDQLLGEPALADAGLAGEQEEAPAAGERVLEAGEQLVELGARGRRTRSASQSRPLGPAGGREIEAADPAEDRLLELAQRAAGLDAELVDEDAPRRPGRRSSASAWRPER